MRQATTRTTGVTSGFTIVELLVATAVTAVLIGLMVTMTSGVLTAWNRTSGTLTANNQAKMVLDQVGQDLQASVARFDPSNPGAVWLAVEILDQWPGGPHTVPTLRTRRGWVTTPDPQSLIVKPTRNEDNRTFDLEAPDLADCRYGFGGAWLRLFSNSTGGQNTVPSPVSYQIVRRHVTSSTANPNPAEVRYMLYRSEITKREEGPLRYGYDLTGTSSAAGPGIGAPNPTPNEHYGDSILPGRLINPGAMDIIANNVIDFGVRLYVRRPPGQPPGLDPIFPVNPATLNFWNGHTRYLADGSTNPLPEVADIMVRILTEEGARQIQNLEAGRTFQQLNNTQKSQEWWNIAEANSRVFTRRVFLNTAQF